VNEGYSDVFFQSADGLRLYARDYGRSGGIPLLCLPGLTRNARDFEPAFPQLTRHYRVIAMDFRGRGRSQYAADPLTYRVDVELGDVIALLDHLNIAQAAVIGTSRGGLVGALMASLHRPRLAGLFLNDIGPVLEKKGLLRIRSYLGVPIEFASFDEAAAALRTANPGFKGMAKAEWLAFARRLYRDDTGVPRLDYDPKLAQTFPTEEQIRSGGVPHAWPLFLALAGLPVALIRGENSDLLGKRTVNAMRKKIPDLDVTAMPRRGHAPFLDEPAAQDAFARWLTKVDAS
jgi:pimeloyl-ACP methyl ester carboxylesterase